LRQTWHRSHGVVEDDQREDPPDKSFISGLAEELDSDVRHLEKLADEIKKDLEAKVGAKANEKNQVFGYRRACCCANGLRSTKRV
jgi:hypothetical protein